MAHGVSDQGATPLWSAHWCIRARFFCVGSRCGKTQRSLPLKHHPRGHRPRSSLGEVRPPRTPSRGSPWGCYAPSEPCIGASAPELSDPLWGGCAPPPHPQLGLRQWGVAPLTCAVWTCALCTGALCTCAVWIHANDTCARQVPCGGPHIHPLGVSTRRIG